MVINMHTHLIHKSTASDRFWESVAESFAIAQGISKEQVLEEVFPHFWASDAKSYVEQMDEAGIDKALILQPDWGTSKAGEAPWSVEKINQWCVDQVALYPDRLFTVCGVNPTRGKDAIALLEKAAREWKLKGVKIYPPTGFYPDDPAFFPFYEKCVELGLALHSHTAGMTAPIGENKYADPIRLDTVAANFPQLKIVLVHFGGPVIWTKVCTEMMIGRANLYAEISSHQVGYQGGTGQWLSQLRGLLDLPPFMGLAPGDRVMFGSDWPYFSGLMNEKSWVDTVKNIPETARQYGLEFTKEEIDKLLYKNAERFLESLG